MEKNPATTKETPPTELQESDLMKKKEFTKIIDEILANSQSSVHIPMAANWLRAHHEISLWAQIKLKKVRSPSF